MRLSIFTVQVVGVIGNDERNPELPAKTQHFGKYRHLLADAVILQFEIEIPLAENREVFERAFFRPCPISAQQELRYAPAKQAVVAMIPPEYFRNTSMSMRGL